MKDLEEYVKYYKLNLNNLVFNGGEEYEFIFTVPPKHKKIIEKNASILKTKIIEIGYVTSGKGVYVGENNNFTRLKDAGWKHF
jgi:thiamine-monophosphate kinase